MVDFPISILKQLWVPTDDGRWAISGLKGLELTHEGTKDSRFFALSGTLNIMTNSPGRSMGDFFLSFGTTEFLMQQSVVPIISWMDGDAEMRCIGTGTIISCSGYVLTAAHVVMDPFETGHGGARVGDSLAYHDRFNFGVLIPQNPASGRSGFLIYPFEKVWSWGSWKPSPLFHEEDRFEYLTDIAICKIPAMLGGGAHQPLSLSLNPFVKGEAAYALGYAEMPDIKLDPGTGGVFKKVDHSLYVSVGSIISTFPQNNFDKSVPAPGPCFDFDAKIPGKMSGAPIFGARGAVIRGVVSRSFSGEAHAYGSMLGPAMELTMSEPDCSDRTLRRLLEQGNEGMAIVHGLGL